MLYVGLVDAAPGLTAGRGLKLPYPRLVGPPRVAAPGLTAGRGSKQLRQSRVTGAEASAAPGLTAGRGLKRPREAHIVGFRPSSARPHGWARIETSRLRTSLGEHPAGRAAPGLTAGRGLKLGAVDAGEQVGTAAPGLTAGRGLKRLRRPRLRGRRGRSARPHGWARIGTNTSSSQLLQERGVVAIMKVLASW